MTSETEQAMIAYLEVTVLCNVSCNEMHFMQKQNNIDLKAVGYSI
jgi:hypothetical protein